MFSPETIQGRAFLAASELQQDILEEEADRLACAAALEIDLPSEREDWLEKYGALIQAGAPFDKEKWEECYQWERRKRLYPRDWIMRWISDSLPAAASQIDYHLTSAIASICERYFDDRSADGYFAKGPSLIVRVDGNDVYQSRIATSKAGGLGNAEVRTQLEKAAQAAVDLAAALHSIRNEALRPGQAVTSRGAIMRDLYLSPFAALIDELGRHLPNAETQQLKSLVPRITASEGVYIQNEMHLPWESALTEFARRFARSAANDARWKTVPSAHLSKFDARSKLVRSLGSVWTELTSAAPTFTDEPSRSPFLKLLSACVGHMAGLTAFRSPTDKARDRKLKHYGLDRVLTARTYKADYYGRKTIPQPPRKSFP